MLRSLAVVVGCYVLSVALVLAGDPLLARLFPGQYTAGRVPAASALLAGTALFIVIALFCAWLCARLAPGRAARHVLWFALLGEAMGLAASAPNWNKGWPHWYFLSWLAAWPVCCWIGLLASGRRAPRPA